ncbi:hypothetical protein F383_24786 [Gossypium arboreum]|uniref:Uncharacterized protein n=1 Tax=Gossypium arboreum TaxID=29729 RepID=A0A0B0P4K7_GOSAR|nr:hypothetical protein F383_24786 [Gossypium arboreum]
MSHRNRSNVLSCKTTSGTLASTYDLRVRPCLGHWHRI